MMEPAAREENVFMTHPSVRIKGTELDWTAAICRLENCESNISRGQHMHCPFCPVKSIFTDPFLLRIHYRVKHVDKGVEFAGLQILRCSNDCFIQGVIKEEKKFKGAHWHCFRCKNAFNRKDEAVKHFKTHFKNPATTFQIQIAQDINQPNIIDMYNKQSGPMSFRMYAKMNSRTSLQQGLNNFMDVQPTVEVEKEEYIISQPHDSLDNNAEIVLISSEDTDEIRKTEHIIEALQKQVNALQEEKEDMERQFQHKIEVLNEEKKLLRQQLESLQQGILSKMPASVLLESQFIARNLEQQFKDFVQFNMSKLSQCFLGMASSEMSPNHVENNQGALYNVTIESPEPGQEFVHTTSVSSEDIVQSVIATEDYVHIDGVTSHVIGHHSCGNSNHVSNSTGNIQTQEFEQSGVITSQQLIQNALTKNMHQVVSSEEFVQASSSQEEQTDISVHKETSNQDIQVNEPANDANAINSCGSVADDTVHYINTPKEIINISLVQDPSNFPSAQFQLPIKNNSNDKLKEQNTVHKRMNQGRITPPLTRKRGKVK